MQAIQILALLRKTGKKPVAGTQIKNELECFLLNIVLSQVIFVSNKS